MLVPVTLISFQGHSGGKNIKLSFVDKFLSCEVQIKLYACYVDRYGLGDNALGNVVFIYWRVPWMLAFSGTLFEQDIYPSLRVITNLY